MWAKKVDKDAMANAVLHLPDYSLCPSFDINLNAVAAPPPPKLPPTETQTPEQQNAHLLSLMGESKITDYSAANPESLGGLKPVKKTKNIKLVDY